MCINGINRAKDRKTLNEKLSGHTLGEAEEGDADDLKSWIKKTKKREREMAEKRAQELENQDQQFQNEYTSSMILSLFRANSFTEHLEGMRVGHDFADIEEGERMILTIKDRGILDEDRITLMIELDLTCVEEDGDELISTALAEKERLKENLDNKIRKPKYDPYAEEYDQNTGEKRLLSKYDDEIEGKKRKVRNSCRAAIADNVKTFTLGTDQEAKALPGRDSLENFNTLTAISLEYDSTVPRIGDSNCLGPLEIASDYVDPSTIKIKKPKKKKPKNTTRVRALLGDEGFVEHDDSGDVGASVDGIASVPLTSTKRAYNEDSGLGDDEELQEMLAQRRRQALKKKKSSRPEDIVRNIRQSRDDENVDASENGRLVIDDTGEFVRGLEMSQLERTVLHDDLLRNEPAPEEMDIDATDGNKDIEMPDEVSQVEEDVGESNRVVPYSGLEDEPIIGGGSMAATLAALRRAGIFFNLVCQADRLSGEFGEATVSSNFTMEDLEKREEIIARQRMRRIQQEADGRRQREQERQNERFTRLSQREKEQHREQQNQARERHEAQQRMREFNDFKFNVDLEYKDEFGQEMTKKDVHFHATIIN